MHPVQGSSDQQMLTDERIRAEIGSLVTPETLPDMTKRLLRRKVEDALCLQQGCLDDAPHRARITRFLQERLDFIRNTTGKDTSRETTRLRTRPLHQTAEEGTVQSQQRPTKRQQQCDAVNAAHRHRILTCISPTLFECHVCKWWHQGQKVHTSMHVHVYSMFIVCL